MNLPPRTIMVGPVEEIAKATPAHDSVIFVSAYDDACKMLDALQAEHERDPLAMRCRVQIADSRTIRNLVIEFGAKPTLFATRHLFAALPASAQVDQKTHRFGAIDGIDRLVDRIPDSGGIIVVADHERVVPIACRVHARRGVETTKRIFVFHAKTEEEERQGLAGSPGLPVFYDPAFPADRTRTRRDGEHIAPPPAAPALTAEQIAAEQERILTQYSGKIRRASRTADRAVHKATWDAFARMLPTRPHVVLVSDQAQIGYVNTWIERVGRTRELRPFLDFRVLPINGQQIPLTFDGVEAYAAPGMTVSQGRCMVRTEMGRLRSAAEKAEVDAMNATVVARADAQDAIARAAAQIRQEAAKAEEDLRAQVIREEERLHGEIHRLEGECNLLRVKVRDLQATHDVAKSVMHAVPAPAKPAHVVPNVGYPFGAMTFIADPAPHAARSVDPAELLTRARAKSILDGFFEQLKSRQEEAIIYGFDPARTPLVVMSRRHPADDLTPVNSPGPYEKGRSR